AALVVPSPHNRLRPSVLWGPCELSAEPDLIRGDGSRSEILDEEQGVMMPLDGKGRRATSEDLDLARCAGLEPEGRALRPRVAEHGAEQELGSTVGRSA